MGKNVHVTKSHHADSLPNTQTNTGRNTTVQTLEAVGIVDILERLADGQVLGTVRVLGLALHLNPNNLNRLVPGGQTTADTRGDNLLASAQFLAVLLTGRAADSVFSQSGKTETRTPVGGLTDCDGVDTLVDTTDTFLAVDVHECLPGAGGLDASSGHLVSGDHDSFHAGTESDSRISLRNTTGHTTDDTSTKIRCAKASGIVFGLGCDEEQHGTFGGSLNPGPGNETLVVYTLH